MSALAVAVLFIAGLVARVLSTTTRAAGRVPLSWLLTGLALLTWFLATVISLSSKSAMSSPTARLWLVVVLLALAAIVGSLVWRYSDRPETRDLSVGQWAVLLFRTLTPLFGLALGIAAILFAGELVAW
jgi:uncharacterized membrane protein AbrB (regulator of aidB expression)